MPKIYNGVIDLIGNTPIVKLNNLQKELSLYANLYAKVEFFNPAGSIKDRVALKMVEDAEKSGLLKAGATIIEPTSGNTGIGIALVCAVKGYKALIVMPENMSEERKKLIACYGAELVLTDAKLGMQGAIDKANELNKSIKNSIIAGQFENLSNPQAHYENTAQEIFDDLDGKIDILVAGIGTGGTITGISKFLKEKNSDIKVIGVEPYNSPFITKGEKGAHNLQGIGAGFLPKILDLSVIDEVVTVKEEDAYSSGKLLAKKEGLLCGISSGASLYAALNVAKDIKYKDKNVVVILPDTGERYLSTKYFD